MSINIRHILRNFIKKIKLKLSLKNYINICDFFKFNHYILIVIHTNLLKDFTKKKRIYFSKPLVK